MRHPLLDRVTLSWLLFKMTYCDIRNGMPIVVFLLSRVVSMNLLALPLFSKSVLVGDIEPSEGLGKVDVCTEQGENIHSEVWFIVVQQLLRILFGVI